MIRGDTRISHFGGNIRGHVRRVPAGEPAWGVIGINTQEGGTDEDHFQINTDPGTSFPSGLLGLRHNDPANGRGGEKDHPFTPSLLRPEKKDRGHPV